MDKDMRVLMWCRCAEIFIMSGIFEFSGIYIDIYQKKYLTSADFGMAAMLMAVFGLIAYQLTTNEKILEWVKNHLIRILIIMDTICAFAVYMNLINTLVSLLIEVACMGLFMRFIGMGSEDYYNTIFQDKNRTLLTSRTRQAGMASAMLTGMFVWILDDLDIHVSVWIGIIGMIFDIICVTIMMTLIRRYIKKHDLRQ